MVSQLEYPEGMGKFLNPETAASDMVQAGYLPLEPYKGSAVKWKVKCLKCEKVVYKTHHSAKRNMTSCNYCSFENKVSGGRMPLGEILKFMKEKNLKPLEPYKNNHDRWKCKCVNCGEIVFPEFNSLRQGRGGCKKCGSIKQSLSARKPSESARLIMEKAGFQPLEDYKSSKRRWKCRCITCKKVTYPTLNNIQAGVQCGYCSGNIVDPKDAVKLMLKAKVKPITPFKGGNKPWKCQCLKCGKIVYPWYASVRAGRGGCMYCAEKGINMNVPSYLYLITNSDLYAHKIGMGNYHSQIDRLGKFNKRGWKTHKVWNFDTGGDAWKVESLIFNVIRKELKLPIFLSKEQMPVTEGHTETINADSITLLELEKIIKKVIKDYRK